ncbi:MAG: protein kinase, partial [Pyrinomonadaceae bacterium]
PENILVDAKTGKLKIADFGLAKLVDEATRSETFKGWGTRPYQAPEAFEQGPNTVAMDIYAGGVLLFELATLTLPIQPKTGDDGPLAWRNAHLLMPPADLRGARPDLPNSMIQLSALMLQKDPKRRPENWNVVIDRLRSDDEPTEGKVDVSGLVEKATQTLLEQTAQETKRREETERIIERNALLIQAVQEPVNILQELVDAFNGESDVGKLVLSDKDGLFCEVTGPAGGKSLRIQTKIIPDLQTQNGIYRVVGMARINPTPTAPKDPQLAYNQDSFGSFNLGYKVSRSEDRFGSWNMLRFEHNPIMGRSGYPHWFAVDFDNLPHQLQVLNALGMYQNQQRQLDHEWFRLLLAHLL